MEWSVALAPHLYSFAGAAPGLSSAAELALNASLLQSSAVPSSPDNASWTDNLANFEANYTDELYDQEYTNSSEDSDKIAWGNSSSPRQCKFEPRALSVSAYDYPYRKSTWRNITAAEAVKITLYVVVFLVAVTGNLLVILVVHYNANLWSSTNRYLVNLAVADLLVALCCIWVHLVRHLASPHYVLPAFVCRLDSFLQATTLSASVLTLTAISVGRFVAVMFPLRAHTSPDRAYRVILLIWLASALLASPLLLYRQLYSIEWKDFRLWQCDEFWPMEGHYDKHLNKCVVTSDPKKLFYTFFIIAIYFMPVTIMVASYSLVVWRLWASKLPGEQCAESRLTVSRSKKKVVKMVTVVVVVFVVCWTPLQSLILYTNFKRDDVHLPEWFETVEYISYFIAHANSAINPIIYCSFNSSLRQGLLALLTCSHSRRSSFHQRRTNWRCTTAGTRETTFGASGAEPGVLSHGNPSMKRANARVLRSGKTTGSLRSTAAHNTSGGQPVTLITKVGRMPNEVSVAESPRHRKKKLERNSSGFSVSSSTSSAGDCSCCHICNKRRLSRAYDPNRHSREIASDIANVQLESFNIANIALKKENINEIVKLACRTEVENEHCQSLIVESAKSETIPCLSYEILTRSDMKLLTNKSKNSSVSCSSLNAIKM
ncbi:substance-K receptor [Hyalella azteca]|uniref:Substance-K receptor n=1 Tax=Hyalella azteca TaxID=294128 RepID=A0A8B7PJQ3_HYAAZ|nr:substance-K receptor [Hyalella azteca]